MPDRVSIRPGELCETTRAAARHLRYPLSASPALTKSGVEFGERLLRLLEFRLERGDLGLLRLARLVDHLVDGGRQVGVQFLRGTGDGGGRDRKAAGHPGAAVLELGLPVPVRRTGHGQR